MTKTSFLRGVLLLTFSLVLPVACETGGVGDPCVPEAEYDRAFAGFSSDEVDAESRSMQCETRLCLVNHFQGRVSCAYGQTDERAKTDPRCLIPGGGETITSAVLPQLRSRRAADTVYCSCRCNGPDANARYCDCPSGFACEEVIPRFGLGKEELAGSYCVREGTVYNRLGTNHADVCDADKDNCKE